MTVRDNRIMNEWTIIDEDVDFITEQARRALLR